MRDQRPQFKGKAEAKLIKRAHKIVALDALNTPEARKAKKELGVHVYSKGHINLNGFFGNQKVKTGKHKRKATKQRLSSPLKFLYRIQLGPNHV